MMETEESTVALWLLSRAFTTKVSGLPLAAPKATLEYQEDPVSCIAAAPWMYTESTPEGSVANTCTL